MKVKDLITKLRWYNQDFTVYTIVDSGKDATEWVAIKDIVPASAGIVLEFEERLAISSDEEGE